MFSVDYIKEGPTDLKLASNFFFVSNHTVDCNQNWTVNGVILWLPAH